MGSHIPGVTSSEGEQNSLSFTNYEIIRSFDSMPLQLSHSNIFRNHWNITIIEYHAVLEMWLVLRCQWYLPFPSSTWSVLQMYKTISLSDPHILKYKITYNMVHTFWNIKSMPRCSILIKLASLFRLQIDVGNCQHQNKFILPMWYILRNGKNHQIHLEKPLFFFLSTFTITLNILSYFHKCIK